MFAEISPVNQSSKLSFLEPKFSYTKSLFKGLLYSIRKEPKLKAKAQKEKSEGAFINMQRGEDHDHSLVDMIEAFTKRKRNCKRENVITVGEIVNEINSLGEKMENECK